MPHKDPQKRKEYARQYNKQWYQKNKKSQKQKVRDREQIILEWFREYKSSLQCSQCDEDHVACLEFHHVDPSKKENAICTMIRNGWSKKKVEKEIGKCIILCCNCHKKLHYSGVVAV